MLDGTLRIFVAEALLLPTGILTTVFLTRRLAPEGYGLFTLALTFIVWVEGALTALFARATVKFVGETPEWQAVGTVVLRLHLLLSCGCAGTLWLLAPLLATLLNEPLFAGYLRLAVLDLPLFSVAQVQRSILVGTGAFRPRALASAGRWTARLVVIVLLVEMGFSVQGALLGNACASLVELLIGRCYVRPSPFRSSQFPPRLLWPYALPLFFSAISLAIFTKLDVVLLKTLGGTAAQAGLYGAAQNFSLLFEIFGFSFAPLLLSTLSHLLSVGDTKSAELIGRNALRVGVGLLPVAALLAGAATEVVQLAFGSQFLPAAPLSIFLIFGSYALLLMAITTALLTAVGRPRATLWLTGPLVPLAIVGHLLLIPRLGPLGAVLVTTGVAGGGALASVLAVYRYWQILPPLGTVWRSLLVSLGMYFLAALWATLGVWIFVKLSLIGILGVVAFVFLGEFSQEELSLASSLGLRVHSRTK
jgi:O-antigen/teichoic acid export membrane protein